MTDVNRMRRTPVYIDAIVGAWVVCTPSGVDLPPGSGCVPVSGFPVALQPSIATGRVFFARVNLNVKVAGELRIEDIEDEWGKSAAIHWGDDGC